jgi:hypothetical protein
VNHQEQQCRHEAIKRGENIVDRDKRNKSKTENKKEEQKEKKQE